MKITDNQVEGIFTVINKTNLPIEQQQLLLQHFLDWKNTDFTPEIIINLFSFFSKQVVTYGYNHSAVINASHLFYWLNQNRTEIKNYILEKCNLSIDFTYSNLFLLEISDKYSPLYPVSCNVLFWKFENNVWVKKSVTFYMRNKLTREDVKSFWKTKFLNDVDLIDIIYL